MDELNFSRCLKIVSDQFVSVVYITGTPGNYRYSGPLITIVDIIMQHLGFCYEFVRASDRSYGLLHSNGSWSGLLGMVQRKEADFTGTLIAMSWKGLPAFEYSEPVFISEYNVIFSRPVVTPNMAGFIRPYTSLSWALLLLSSVIVSVVTLLLLRGHAILQKVMDRTDALREEHMGATRSSEFRKEEELKDISWSRSVEKASLWTWSAILSQSVPWEPLGSSARLLAGLWLLETLILASVYRSNLKAMLIIPKVHLPFDNLEELVESGINLAISKDSTLQTLIMNAENNTSLGRLKDSILIVHPDDAPSMFPGIWGGKWAGSAFTISLKAAFHGDFSMVGECRGYMMSRGFFGPASLSLAFARGSPLLAKVNRVLVTLRESGISDYLLSAAHYNATECLKPITLTLATPKERPLELLDFYGVFSLYVAGIVLALMVFLLEVTCYPAETARERAGVTRPSERRGDIYPKEGK